MAARKWATRDLGGGPGMTTVRAQCPACGDVQLHIDDLTVRVCQDDDTPSAYRFRCPGCDETVHREASPRIVDLLVSAGAPGGGGRWPPPPHRGRGGAAPAPGAA